VIRAALDYGSILQRVADGCEIEAASSSRFEILGLQVMDLLQRRKGRNKKSRRAPSEKFGSK
jgi:hypothetical protein